MYDNESRKLRILDAEIVFVGASLLELHCTSDRRCVVVKCQCMNVSARVSARDYLRIYVNRGFTLKW